MFDLFLPFILGVAVGIEPPRDDAPPVVLEPSTPPLVFAPMPPGSGDELGADREPEPQIPTGQFTTAAEVRPILGMTKSNWVGVREYEGQDLVYFTHLLGWRCGLWDISYGINGAPADTVVAMEPCNTDYAQPNAMIDMDNFTPFVSYPVGTVESIYIEIVYDDGTTDFARFDRDQVRIP